MANLSEQEQEQLQSLINRPSWQDTGPDLRPMPANQVTGEVRSYEPGPREAVRQGVTSLLGRRAGNFVAGTDESFPIGLIDAVPTVAMDDINQIQESDMPGWAKGTLTGVAGLSMIPGMGLVTKPAVKYTTKSLSRLPEKETLKMDTVMGELNRADITKGDKNLMSRALKEPGVVTTPQSAGTDPNKVKEYLAGLGFKQDNPGGDWLARAQREAMERYAPHEPGLAAKGVAGATTAWTKEPINVRLSSLGLTKGGVENELRAAGDHKYDALMEKVQREGWNQVDPIHIVVNHKGEAYIAEGNTRLAVAQRLGIDKVKATIAWTNGGETAPGYWSWESMYKRANPSHADASSVVPTPGSEVVNREALAKAVDAGTLPLEARQDHNYSGYGIERIGYENNSIGVNPVHVYEGPFKTNSGAENEHFRGSAPDNGVFGFVRSFDATDETAVLWNNAFVSPDDPVSAADMAPATRHIIEVQSDLFSRPFDAVSTEWSLTAPKDGGNLSDMDLMAMFLTQARELAVSAKLDFIETPDVQRELRRVSNSLFFAAEHYRNGNRELAESSLQHMLRNTENPEYLRTLLSDLPIYIEKNNTRNKHAEALKDYKGNWYKRLLREEYKKASEDGISTLRVATGDTAAKVEGWQPTYDSRPEILQERLDVLEPVGSPDLVGASTVSDYYGDSDLIDRMVVTLWDTGDDSIRSQLHLTEVEDMTMRNFAPLIEQGRAFYKKQFEELTARNTHPFAGTPYEGLYNLYDKDFPKFLKQEYGADNLKRVTDDKGNSWWEIKVDPEAKNKPITAYTIGGAGIGAGAAGASQEEDPKAKVQQWLKNTPWGQTQQNFASGGLVEEQVAEEPSMLSRLMGLFSSGPDINNPPIYRPGPMKNYPTAEDAEKYTPQGLGYGSGNEQFINGVISTETKESLLKGDGPPAVRTMGNRPKKGSDKSLMSAYARAQLAADAIPLAGLGYDASKFVLDRKTSDNGKRKLTLGGQYSPSMDNAWVDTAHPDAIAHEAIHRGVKLLADKKIKHPNERMNSLVQRMLDGPLEESLTRELMRTMAGNPEEGKGKAGDVQIKSAEILFGDRQYKEALDWLNKQAAEEIAVRKGPRPRM